MAESTENHDNSDMRTPKLTVGGNIYGLQYGGKQNHQVVNITDNEGLDEVIGKMLQTIQSLTIGNYEKSELTHSLKQIQSLSKLEKTPDVIQKAKDKLEVVEKVVKTGNDLATILGPYLPAIAQYFSS